MRDLESVTSQIIDCEHKTAPEGDGFAFAVGTKAMKGGRIVLEQCRPVSEETYGKWARRGIPESGDLVLAREAPVGEVVRLPDSPRFCLGQRTVLIKPDKDAVDGRFLHYWLQGPFAQHQMQSIASGAVTPHLNVGDIRSLSVATIPESLARQRLVGEILGSIDDLIENNRRRIEILEEMVQAIYREWFVHFRFPGHETATFVDSPIGPIPEDWTFGQLSDIADLTKTTVHPSKEPESLFKHYSIPAYDEHKRPSLEPGSEIRSGKFVVPNSCVLLSKLNPRIPRTWLVEERSDVSAVASTEFLVLTPRPNFNLAHIYLTVSNRDFQARLQALTGGTSGSHQRAKPGDVMQLDIPIAPTEIIDNAFAWSSTTLAMQHSLADQNARLAVARDRLLPKLVSGEIDVSDLDLDAVFEGSV